MKRLTEHGFIDDVRYAERMARKLVEVKRFGCRRCKRELIQKGISGFIAEDALAPYSEAFGENLMELLRTKHSRYLTDIEDRKQIEKVKSALVRYGYDYPEINRAVKEYFESRDDLEEEN
jgi:regulatory protein